MPGGVAGIEVARDRRDAGGRDRVLPDAARVATVRWNVLPSPGTPALSAHIVPPIASASRLEIARPSPVPPYLRLVEASAWLNDWNMRPMAAAEMPMPVSVTVT